jgi:hypothetical protein
MIYPTNMQNINFKCGVVFIFGYTKITKHVDVSMYIFKYLSLVRFSHVCVAYNTKNTRNLHACSKLHH